MRFDIRTKIKNPIFWAGLVSELLHILMTGFGIKFNVSLLNAGWLIVSNGLIAAGIFINPNTQGLWDYPILPEEGANMNSLPED